MAIIFSIILEMKLNTGRAGGGILCRMLFIELHRLRGLSEFSEITSAKYFDSFYYTGGIDVCNENDLDVCEICAMFVRDCGEGF